MTMQIGMVGSDGIVLASDTQWTSTVQPMENGEPKGYPVRYITHSSKIKTNDRMAVSYGQDKKTAHSTAEAILTSFPCDNPNEAIKQIADGIPAEERRDVQGLIAIPPDHLYRFQIAMQNAQWTPSCEPAFQYDMAGDVANLSAFWIRRYHQEWLTVEQLIPLAAHMITAAHIIHNGTIGGLEIAICKMGEIIRLPRERTRALAKEAWERDKAITEMIFGKGVSL